MYEPPATPRRITVFVVCADADLSSVAQSTDADLSSVTDADVSSVAQSTDADLSSVAQSTPRRRAGVRLRARSA